MSRRRSTQRLVQLESTVTDEQFEQLKARLEKLLGLDLDAYKQAQMRRRITTHVGRSSKDVDAFIADLGTDKSELAELRDMITINVTEFFRDEAQWTQLRRSVLPELVESQSGRLSIWSAGCSTGQEPYSLAMLLAEAGALEGSKILGTDFDREALAKARAGGPYPRDIMKGVSARELGDYFDEGDDGFTAKADLRRHLRFSEVNLLSDRFGRGYDLVVCRNVMIYFNADVKSALIDRFIDSLKPGGILFIGATEALLGDDLKSLGRLGGNFYRKQEAAATTRAA